MSENIRPTWLGVGVGVGVRVGVRVRVRVKVKVGIRVRVRVGVGAKVKVRLRVRHLSRVEVEAAQHVRREDGVEGLAHGRTRDHLVRVGVGVGG